MRASFAGDTDLDHVLASSKPLVSGSAPPHGIRGVKVCAVLEQAVNNAGTGSTTSILTQAQNANSTEESNLNTTISTMDARIATQQANLTTALNVANQTLQEIPMQLNMVNEIYSAITGFNQNQNG